MRTTKQRILEKIICIHKEDCESCNGITNSCGYYENLYNINPFTEEFVTMLDNYKGDAVDSK